jgi:hypothetical protein
MKIGREEFIADVRGRFGKLAPALDERSKRLWAATEADAFGRGGIAWVSTATGIARSTIGSGLTELRAGLPKDALVNVRRRGAGRKRAEVMQPGLASALEALVSPTAPGDPEKPLRWTSKSVVKLSAELRNQGFHVGASKVAELLREAGYSLQGTAKLREKDAHPDRDKQIEHINERASEFTRRGVPVISVDTKKKELVGEFANAGREWRPKGTPVEVLTYTLFGGEQVAIPYGVYDLARNEGFVNVGLDHDTPGFAAHSIKRWWELLGAQRYPDAREIFITADGGGSNASKSNVWKAKLQELANTLNLTIHVSHFPPGTSKWNKIEHRLFSFISMNWRGKPLTTYETVVSLISGTTTRRGLKVTAELDRAKYPLGMRLPKNAMATMLNIERNVFHGEWNYSLRPASGRTDAIDCAPKQINRRAENRQRWKALFREHAASGVSQSEFCRKHGIKRPTFSKARTSVVGRTRPREITPPAEWRRLIEEQRLSGLSVSAFCRARGIEQNAFRQARRRLGLQLIQRPAGATD